MQTYALILNAVPSNHGAEETDTASEPQFGITAIGIFLRI